MTLNHHAASSLLLHFTFHLALGKESSLSCISQLAEFFTVFGGFEHNNISVLKKGKTSRSRNKKTDSARSEVPIYWLLPLGSPNPTNHTSIDVR